MTSSTQSTNLQIPGYAAGTWTIDPVHTHVGFVIKHLMVSKVRGHFGAFSGQIVTAEDPLASAVTASIDVASINTNNEMRDDHILSPDFFDAEHHPATTFTSTGIRAENDGSSSTATCPSEASPGPLRSRSRPQSSDRARKAA